MKNKKPSQKDKVFTSWSEVERELLTAPAVQRPSEIETVEHQPGEYGNRLAVEFLTLVKRQLAK